VRRNERGFTLIELMIVIAIIGILAAVAIPNFMNARDRAKIAAAASILGSLRTALEMYMTDESRYPNTTDEPTFETVMAPYMTNFAPPGNSNWAYYEVNSVGGPVGGGVDSYSVMVECRDRAPASWLFINHVTSDIWINNDCGANPGFPASQPPVGNWVKYVK